jgi:hypothetical protein
MPTAKRTPVLVMAVAVGLAAAGVVVLRRYASPPAPTQPPASEVEPVTILPQPMAEQVVAPTVATALPPAPQPPAPRVELPTPAKPAAAPRPAPIAPPVETIPLPLARLALSYVGDDPLAEQVWVEAINDPSFSAHDRQDLIEDLNEEGFPDPKNITMDDLPLIVNRMALIEELADDAMDDVNAAAFEEAYKDLVNMLFKLSRQ